MQATLFFDFDSTLCQLESLDQALLYALANHPHKQQLAAQIGDITDAAMAGEIDLSESISARLKLLPLSKQAVADTAALLANQLTSGMPALLAELTSAGHSVHIISGGFDELIEPSRVALGIPADRCHANQFVYTADLVSDINRANPLSRSDGKSTVIREVIGAKPGAVFMIGDGYNDLQVLLQGHCDHFIGFGANAYRESIQAQSPHYVTSVADLNSKLNSLLLPLN